MGKDYAQLYIEGMHRAGYLDLSKEQTDLILDILPAPLSGFVKGAVKFF
jgi:hypothetical protein